LTPPDNPAPEEAGPGDVEEDPHGRDAPSEADSSVRNEDGSPPFSSLCINAFDMDDFFISPFHHFETFDDELTELWARVYSRIVRELISAVVSHDGDFSARQRRLAAAARWYAGMGQLFFRNPTSNHGRNTSILRVRFKQFVAGDFQLVIATWRRD